MELFSTLGFYPGDKVFKILSEVKYFGVVLDVDEAREKVKVDYTGKGKEKSDWFDKTFWQIVD